MLEAASKASFAAGEGVVEVTAGGQSVGKVSEH